MLWPPANSPLARGRAGKVKARKRLRRRKRLKAKQVGERLPRLRIEPHGLIRVTVRSLGQVRTALPEEAQVERHGSPPSRV